MQKDYFPAKSRVLALSTSADAFGYIPKLIVCIAAHKTHLSIVAALPYNGT